MSPQALWEGLPTILGAASGDLQAALGGELVRYTDRIRLTEKTPGPKIINDPVWHTVRLESWEVVVLDSPVVQRLRGIRQLGLAWLVFPGEATHGSSTASARCIKHSVSSMP